MLLNGYILVGYVLVGYVWVGYVWIGYVWDMCDVLDMCGICVVIGGIRITKPADANLLKRYVLQPFEWIRIAWIRTGGIRMGGIRLEWICVGYV